MSLVCAETLVQVATKTLLPAVRKIAVMQGIVHCCIAIVSPPLEFADILMPFPNLSFSLTHTHTHTHTSTGTTDSGIISEPSKPSVDEQIDHYLIELQMYASVITQTLMRTEYSTT